MIEPFIGPFIKARAPKVTSKQHCPLDDALDTHGWSCSDWQDVTLKPSLPPLFLLESMAQLSGSCHLVAMLNKPSMCVRLWTMKRLQDGVMGEHYTLYIHVRFIPDAHWLWFLFPHRCAFVLLVFHLSWWLVMETWLPAFPCQTPDAFVCGSCHDLELNAHLYDKVFHRQCALRSLASLTRCA